MTPPIEHHDRLTEIKAIHRDYRNFYQLLRGVVLVAVLAGIGVLIFSSDLPSYWQNIYVTIVGAIGTVLIIDQRAEQRAIRQRKEELIAQMGSRSNAFALEAVRLLRIKKWLMDGSMNGANLSRGELENAELQFADLQLVDMTETNLKKTNFMFANLRGARCDYANLYGSNMIYSNLEGANLHLADLRNANLLCANLRGTVLKDCEFDETTQLPDGSYWYEGIEMPRFTNPERTDFWYSRDIQSPAYRPPPKPSI